MKIGSQRIIALAAFIAIFAIALVNVSNAANLTINASTPYQMVNGYKIYQLSVQSNSSVASTSAGILNIALESNWAGYVSYIKQPLVTSIVGSWAVQTAGKLNPSESAQWIGIGGYKDGSLIQTGTYSDYNSQTPNYGTWYELLPANAVAINGLAVSPGDLMQANITLISGTTNMWTIELVDISTKQGFTANVEYTSSRASAEWIDEEPTQCPDNKCYSLEQLNPFGTAYFGNGLTGGNLSNYANMGNGYEPLSQLPNLTRSAIQNENAFISYQILAQPSSIVGNSSFTVNYISGGPTISVAPDPINQGELSTITASWNGGTPPYTVTFYSTQNILAQTPCSGGVTVGIESDVYGNSAAIRKEPFATSYYCATISDSAGNIANTTFVPLQVLPATTSTSSTTTTSTSSTTSRLTTSTSTTSTSTKATSSTSMASTSTTTAPTTTIPRSSWIPTTNYPIYMDAGNCVTNSSYIYCISGAYSSVSHLVLNYSYYAPISSNGIGSWIKTSSYPSNRTEFSCVTSKGYVYCLGGTDYFITDAAYYAPLSSKGIGVWNTANSYPLETLGVSCDSYNSYIYCVGGEFAGNSSTYFAPLGSNGIGQWKSTTAYPINITYNSCTTANGNIYCVGGTSSTPGTNTNFTVHRQVYYAPISQNGIGTWKSAGNYPQAVYYPSCVAGSMNIYCIGGETYNAQNNSYYNTNATYTSPIGSGFGTWQISNSYPTPIAYESCVTGIGHVYCAGGNGDGADATNVYYIQIPSNTTTTTSTSTTSTTSRSTTSTTTIAYLSVVVSVNKTVLTSGQYVTLTATGSGGSPPYSYTYYNGSANGGLLQQCLFKNGTTCSFRVFSNKNGQTFSYYALVRDSTHAHTNSPIATITVNSNTP